MFGNSLALISALVLASAASAQIVSNPPDDAKKGGFEAGKSQTGGGSYGDRNRGGPYGFYSYPSHRHIDRSVADRGLTLDRGEAGSSYADTTRGSAYYGRDYGAPYFGGGYYDQGVYYRERRDR